MSEILWRIFLPTKYQRYIKEISNKNWTYAVQQSSKVADLERELSRTSAEIERLRAELNRWSKSHEEIGRQVQDKDAEIERLTAELADCNGWRLIPPPERRIKELEAALAEAREFIKDDACDCVGIQKGCARIYAPNGCPHWAKRKWLERNP